MRLIFFGRLRDTVGAGKIDRSLPTNIVNSESLRLWIGGQYPDLLDPKVRIAIDDVLAAGPVAIADSSEAAFLPPVSGG